MRCLYWTYGIFSKVLYVDVYGQGDKTGCLPYCRLSSGPHYEMVSINVRDPFQAPKCLRLSPTWQHPESRDLASEWLPFSSYIALIWLQFGFNTAFSEDLGLLPDCYQIAVLCHLAAKRFFSFASVWLQFCFNFASVWLQFCFNFASVLLHFGFLRSNAIFIVCSRWLVLLQLCFSFASTWLPSWNRSHAFRHI